MTAKVGTQKSINPKQFFLVHHINGWTIGLHSETKVCLYMHVRNSCSSTLTFLQILLQDFKVFKVGIDTLKALQEIIMGRYIYTVVINHSPDASNCLVQKCYKERDF